LTNYQAYANIRTLTEQYNPEKPSTPQQAEDIYKQLGELTALQGKNYGDSHSFGEVAVVAPDSVSDHFPPTETDSESISRTLYVTQKLDRATGHPRRDGVVGLVTFMQKEKRDADLGYSTNVNYHVISDDGETYRLERHVTSTEFGKHRVAQEAGRAVTREAMEQQLAELIALRDRVTESRKVEAELDISTVNALEAQQIVETLSALNQNR